MTITNYDHTAVCPNCAMHLWAQQPQEHLKFSNMVWQKSQRLNGDMDFSHQQQQQSMVPQSTTRQDQSDLCDLQMVPLQVCHIPVQHQCSCRDSLQVTTDVSEVDSRLQSDIPSQDQDSSDSECSLTTQQCDLQQQNIIRLSGILLRILGDDFNDNFMAHQHNPCASGLATLHNHDS